MWLGVQCDAGVESTQHRCNGIGVPFVVVECTQLAAYSGCKATDEVHIVKNPAAVALGRLGGLKSGRVRAERLSSAR